MGMPKMCDQYGVKYNNVCEFIAAKCRIQELTFGNCN